MTTPNSYWSMTEGIFNCLIDTERTTAFAQAIMAAIRPGDVAVDMGAGSGVLAMLAARAGARRVYAVELDGNNLATLESVFRANGLADRVVLVQGDVCTVDLPEKVDVIIGEMIATALIEELQVPAMNNMLRFTKGGKHPTRVVLSQYVTSVDLVSNPERYHGLEFKIVRYEYPDMHQLKSTPLSTKHVISAVDFTRTITNQQVNQTLQVVITQRGTINGLRLSSESIFCDGSRLGATYAYSYPVILPIETREVNKGDVLRVSIRYTLCGGMKTLHWAIE